MTPGYPKEKIGRLGGQNHTNEKNEMSKSKNKKA